MTSRLADAVRGEFDPSVVYLNSASLGLPPRRSLEALRAALDEWKSGLANPPDYDGPLNASRESYASLVGVPAAMVAAGSQASVFAGLVAANLPDGAEVLTANGEFTSIVFPFLAQSSRGIRVREVPLEEIADHVTPATALVAVAAVQSADGRLVDLEALKQAAVTNDVKVLLDTTQAIGWLPIRSGDFAYTVCGGYKWLLAPRGTCFFTIQPELKDTLIPHNANWYAGAEPWSSIYGGPLRLSNDARRFDVSPAWHSWVGQQPSLDLLTEIGAPGLHAHALGLANRFRNAVDLAMGDSAIVSVLAADDVADRLEEARIVGSVRAGRLRLAFHLNNTGADADRAAETLAGYVRA